MKPTTEKGEKILHLTLKKKWFDMIASGEKKEEYREIKMYWWKRLVECGQCYKGYTDGVDDLKEELLPVEQWKMLLRRSFDVVRFKNGYGKNAPVIDLKFIDTTIGIGKTRWGSQSNTIYFIIKLGEIIK